MDKGLYLIFWIVAAFSFLECEGNLSEIILTHQEQTALSPALMHGHYPEAGKNAYIVLAPPKMTE